MRNRMELVDFYLSRYRGFARLEDSEKALLLNKAIKFGSDAAKEIISEFETADPRKLAEKLGVAVQGKHGGIKERFIRWSEYRSKNKEIFIYRDSLNILLRKGEGSSFVFDQPIKLLIAHELFHHLEEEQLGFVYDRFKARVKIGPFKFQKRFKFLSEVAAHAFVETLLGLDCSPVLFESLSLPKEVKDETSPVLVPTFNKFQN